MVIVSFLEFRISNRESDIINRLLERPNLISNSSNDKAFQYSIESLVKRIRISQNLIA